MKTLKDKNARTSFAVAVSKKVADKAAARNRLRRRVYHSLRTFLPLLKEEGHRGIFFAKRGADTLLFRGIKEEIHTLLKQAGLIPPR